VIRLPAFFDRQTNIARLRRGFDEGRAMRGKRVAKIVIALAIVAVVYSARDDIAKLWQDLHVQIVEHPTPKKTVWLDQGVSKKDLS